VPAGNHLNVVLIVIDAGRRSRFGCYGYTRGTTPVIDGLARSGTIFERMITTSAWTLPAHASLFTGLYPREHDAERPGYRMREGILTLAQHLDKHGYVTAVFSNNRLVSKSTGLVDGVSATLRRHANDPAVPRPLVERLGVLVGQADRGAARTNRRVQSFLQGTGGRPFFIFINYMECHGPYRPLRQYERRFVRRPFTLIDSGRHRLRMRRRLAWDGLGWTPGELALLGDLYDASLAGLDARIGDLLSILDRAGRGGETLVVITADHGEELGEKGRWGHELYLEQSLIHIPFIASIPGRPAARAGGLVQVTDVFAGLCGVLELPVPSHLQGRLFSADPFSLGPLDPGRPFAFSQWQEWQGGALQRRLQRAPRFHPTPSAEAVQDRRYKLTVEPGTGAERLVDLSEDPAEVRNRAADLPAERQRLMDGLERWRALFQPVGTATPYSAEEERAMTARLEEMGYL